MYEPSETKAVVTVSEMARMVGLSRARFYQLVEAGVFPPPAYNVSTRRPVYSEQMQRDCLEVRRHRRGVNGQVVLFYSTTRRPKGKARLTAKATLEPKADTYDELLDSVQGLGLGAATRDQVTASVRRLFPDGFDRVGRGEVIRAVFLDLRRPNVGDEEDGR
jgi:hypothetical protein